MRHNTHPAFFFFVEERIHEAKTAKQRSVDDAMMRHPKSSQIVADAMAGQNRVFRQKLPQTSLSDSEGGRRIDGSREDDLQTLVD